MVNTRQKGNRIERKAEQQLENQGYQISRMPHTRYGPSDFFNMYDIIAMKPGAPLKMIQVKANQPPTLTQFKEKALKTTPLEHVQIEIWTHHDRLGWKTRRLNRVNKEWETLVDERKTDGKIGEELKKQLN